MGGLGGVWGPAWLSHPPLSPQRSMCAISALGCSDLLSPEQIFAVTRQRLQHLSQGSPGPVANRATKVTLGTSLCQIPRVGGSWHMFESPWGHTAFGNGSVYVPEGWVWLPFPGAGSLGGVMLPLSPGRGHWGQSLCLGKGARAKPFLLISLCPSPVPDAAAVRGPVPGPALPEGPTPTLGPLGGLSRGPAHGHPSPAQRDLPDPPEPGPDPCGPHGPR